MDKVRLVIKNLRPISVNRLHYRNRKLTHEAREFRALFLEQLQPYADALNSLSKAFDPSKHGLALSYTFKMPTDEFYTKKGHISLRSQDLDNLFKLINDCLTNKKYSQKEWLAQKLKSYKESKWYKYAKGKDSLTNLDIDDKFIIDVNAKKRPNLSESDKHELILTISLTNIA